MERNIREVYRLKFNIGDEFKIRIKTRLKAGEYRIQEGKVIQDCPRHVILESPKGIRESFLKIDLLMGEVRFSEKTY